MKTPLNGIFFDTAKVFLKRNFVTKDAVPEKVAEFSNK